MKLGVTFENLTYTQSNRKSGKADFCDTTKIFESLEETGGENSDHSSAFPNDFALSVIITLMCPFLQRFKYLSI